jgi:competence protein ComEC
MAKSAVAAPSTRPWRLQTPWRPPWSRAATFASLEAWLEAERDQLILWLPVAFGIGIGLWFVLPSPAAWRQAIATMTAIGLGGLAIGRHGRAARALAVAALTVALGTGLVWWRADRVAAPVLARPVIATFTATVLGIEPLAARELVRLTLAPAADASLPPRLRVNLAAGDVPAGLAPKAVISLQARLMPPPAAAVPGAYDYARVAWFAGIGGTGRGFAPVTVIAPGDAGSGLRAALTRHITAQLPGSAGGIAAALATGDEGSIATDDAMLLVTRLLALFPILALRVRLPVVAGVAGALAAIGYTLLTGSQVPTIRSCVAALLVLVALALGREAMTLRLLAMGALVVLLLWPEALVGPSFQLSFTAIAAIVALHEHPWVMAQVAAREEGRARALARSTASLLVTGLAVELALMPIAVFHFHKAGLYGALANIVAIPLTTFVIMPLEALALFADIAGGGAPLWWLADGALRALLWIARTVAAAPGAAVALPAMPDAAFGLMIGGGLWLMLWRTRWRALGLAPLAAGAFWALTTPASDLLVTGDGRHLAIRTPAGLALLRDRAGDYTRSMLAENGGVDGEPLLLADQPAARCSRDLCITDIHRGALSWRIMATRSAYPVPTEDLSAACAGADIIVSERWLPRRCTPRWLRLDKPVLARTGGVAVTLATGTVATVRMPGDRHPWLVAPTIAPNRPAYHSWPRRRSSLVRPR